MLFGNSKKEGRDLMNELSLFSGSGGVVDGLANRVDRLKALGNGQVPLVVARAWEILK